MGRVTTPRIAAPTRRMYSWTSSAALLNQFTTNEGTRSASPRRPRQAQVGAAQAFDVVAKGGGLLEVEIGGGRFHLFLQAGQVSVEFALCPEHLGAVPHEHGSRHVVTLVDARHHIVELADDRLGRDAMLGIVDFLHRAAAFRLADA